MNNEEMETLTSVLQRLKHKHHFDIYDVEDIYQEGFIIGMKALAKYSIKLNISLENFLYVYIGSRLKNFKRDNSVRQDSRCNRCKRFDPNCKLCQVRDKTQTRKKNILKPLNIETCERPVDNCSELELEFQELRDKISNGLTTKERADYLKIRAGIYVQKARKEEIERLVWDIIT